jgi:voltage-gated potassium channel
MLSLRRMGTFTLFLSVLIYGIVGAKTLGHDFDREITTWGDALYFVITTITTVGYGEITPITETARWFTIFLMLLGISTFLLVIGALLGPYLEERFARVIGMTSKSRAGRLTDHIVIVGISDETRVILEKLKSTELQFVLIDKSPEVHDELMKDGIETIVDDASEEHVLEAINLSKARALIVSSDDDAFNAFVVITARKLVPKLKIIAKALSRENIKKLRSVGTDKVIAPSVIGGERILDAAMEGE